MCCVLKQGCLVESNIGLVWVVPIIGWLQIAWWQQNTPDQHMCVSINKMIMISTSRQNEIFQNNQANTMTVDAMPPCTDGTPGTMIWSSQYKRPLVFHLERFQLPVPCQLKITQIANIQFYAFWNKSRSRGWSGVRMGSCNDKSNSNSIKVCSKLLPRSCQATIGSPTSCVDERKLEAG